MWIYYGKGVKTMKRFHTKCIQIFEHIFTIDIVMLRA